MDDRFPICLPYVRREEGGNDDDPRDPGGRTSRGITQREYDAYCQTHGLPGGDVWQAPDSVLDDIYRTQYWLPYCPALPPGVDLVFFDFCVNAGQSRAVKALQTALGVDADGMLGVRTKAALKTCSNVGALIHDYSEYRRRYYRALKTFKTFGRGWLARTGRIEQVAAQMAQSVPYAAGESAGSPKAVDSEIAKPPVSPEASGTTATGAVAAAGAVDQIQQAAQQLAPFQDTLHVVKWILVGVAVLGFGAALYGIWHRNQTQQALGG